MKKKLSLCIQNTEKVLKIICRGFAWFNILLLFTILLQVFLRYFFDRPTIILTEFQWHFYAVIIMVALAYAQLEEAHVGVDILYEKLPLHWQHRVEIVAHFLFLIPLYLFIVIKGLDFVGESFRLQEQSAVPGGLPWRWIIKSFIPIGAILLILASVTRSGKLLLGQERETRPTVPTVNPD